MTARAPDALGLFAALATLALALLWAFPLLHALTVTMGEGVTIRGVGSYLAALTGTEVGRWYLNSAVTSAAVTLGVLAVSAPCAFALSRLEFSGRRALWWFILGSVLVPAQALIVNHFLLMNAWGLINTWAGVVLPQLVAPVAVIVYRRFFDAVPPELAEAAALDGAGPWQVFWRVYLPLTRGVTAALGIVTFIAAWNAFLWPFLVVTRTEMMTITVAVSQAQDVWEVGGLAAALLAGLPVALLYLLLQSRVTEAVALSAGLGASLARPAGPPPARAPGPRDHALDLLKTLLVAGMISAHVVQLVTWTPPGWARGWSDLVNLVAFSGFLLAFGLGVGLAADRAGPERPLPERPLSQRLGPAGRVLLAAWASSFGFLLLVEREPVTASLAWDVVSTRVLFGWSEFLTSFVALYLILAVARPLLVAVARRGEALVAVGALCLATTMLGTGRLWPLVGGLIPHWEYPNFPVLAYLPWFLAGVRLGLKEGRPDRGDLLLALAASGTFLLAWWTGGYLPERFPPSVAWIAGPALPLLGLLWLAGRLAPRLPRPDLLLAAGRHVLASLLVSNLLIFAVRYVWRRPVEGGPAIVGASLALLALVTLWGLWLDRGVRGRG